MEKSLDCVVCGSCVVDVLVRPVDLSTAIGCGNLLRTEPLVLTTGGIVSNAGITLARLGMRTAAFTYLGDDAWADVIRRRYAAEGVDASHLKTLPHEGSSTSAVLIDADGERSFLHAVGAPKKLDKQAFLNKMDLWRRSRAMLLGYYPLLPNLQDELPEVLTEIRKAGCLTALDAAGDGGAMQPLDRILPQLDVYVPSFDEAQHQTGEDDPRKIVETYRSAGARGLLGVKLGSDGALLSPKDGEWIKVDAVSPPGEVVDTTGAGDCFLGGLLCGLLRGMDAADAGRLGAAAGACCVTALGASEGVQDFETVAKLAGREFA